MKRPNRAWPRGIVEIPARRPDPRADPQATQKISREELEEALRRTKSGTRAAVRSSPDLARQSLPGPRDDGPEVSIVSIDSVELSVIDPASLLPPSATPVAAPSRTSPLTPSINVRPSQRSLTSSLTRRLHVTPRLAFFVGLAVVVFVTLAAIVGFLAGRITGL